MFTPKPVTQKNPEITEEIKNILLSQILSELDKLSETVEIQIGYILALEKKSRSSLLTQKKYPHSKSQPSCHQENRDHG